MAEDANPSTLARDQQLSQKILADVANGLSARGFLVYDEEVITYDNYAQGRSRRSNEELIDIAASVTRPRIDMVVFVVVEEKLRSGKYLDKAGAWRKNPTAPPTLSINPRWPGGGN